MSGAHDMLACPVRERELPTFAVDRSRACTILCDLYPGPEFAWYSLSSIFVTRRFPSPFRARVLPSPKRAARSVGRIDVSVTPHSWNGNGDYTNGNMCKRTSIKTRSGLFLNPRNV